MDANTVIEIIRDALRASKDARINDVTTDRIPLTRDSQIVLTTDDGKQVQTWTISPDDIHETDAPE